MSDRIRELLRIDKMSISELSKMDLQDSVASRPDVRDYLVIIDNCVDETERRGDTEGVLELLEYRRKVMLESSEPAQFSDEEHQELFERIQALAAKLDEKLKQEARDAEQARRNAIPTLVEAHPSKRGSRKKSRKW